jgi:hypothetical protein
MSLFLVGCNSGGKQERYILTPKGNERPAKAGEFGLPKKDIDFLSVFRGRLINHLPKGSGELRELIRSTVSKEEGNFVKGNAL